jgi:hypothetical protein
MDSAWRSVTNDKATRDLDTSYSCGLRRAQESLVALPVSLLDHGTGYFWVVGDCFWRAVDA